MRVDFEQYARPCGQEVIVDWAGGIMSRLDFDTTMEYRDNGVLCGVKRSAGVSRGEFFMQAYYFPSQKHPRYSVDFFSNLPLPRNNSALIRKRDCSARGHSINGNGIVIYYVTAKMIFQRFYSILIQNKNI